MTVVVYKYGKPYDTFHGIPARDLTEEDVEALGPAKMRDVIANASYKKVEPAKQPSKKSEGEGDKE